MRKTTRLRFWIEAGTATLTGLLLLITLIWKDWIEIVFYVDPDGGNGSLEWWSVGTLLVFTLMLSGLARREWRRLQTSGADGE